MTLREMASAVATGRVEFCGERPPCCIVCGHYAYAVVQPENVGVCHQCHEATRVINACIDGMERRLNLRNAECFTCKRIATHRFIEHDTVKYTCSEHLPFVASYTRCTQLEAM